ncbi:hypothetical protein O181_036733 [Austropuccinia psidii MF-1]|uniref:Uncharacterized protein n=1 Tax=Austropuccinia psidii MF-1 TaxID=1389203 RepID=A0A9Q3H9G4_9BASI|nr:hypothetical protein [Austropuccinia psidii MF-1]
MIERDDSWDAGSLSFTLPPEPCQTDLQGLRGRRQQLGLVMIERRGFAQAATWPIQRLHSRSKSRFGSPSTGAAGELSAMASTVISHGALLVGHGSVPTQAVRYAPRGCSILSPSCLSRSSSLFLRPRRCCRAHCPRLRSSSTSSLAPLSLRSSVASYNLTTASLPSAHCPLPILPTSLHLSDCRTGRVDAFHISHEILNPWDIHLRTLLCTAIDGLVRTVLLYTTDKVYPCLSAVCTNPRTLSEYGPSVGQAFVVDTGHWTFASSILIITLVAGGLAVW